MKPEIPSLESDIIHGKRRTYYSVRIIALCCGVAALVAALVSIPVVITLSGDVADEAYKADVRACERNQKARKDANVRLITQRRDAKNLGELTRTLSEVRAAEAGVFRSMGRAFDISEEVRPLVRILEKASLEDGRIAEQQEQVVFKNLPILDCRSEKVIPKP